MNVSLERINEDYLFEVSNSDGKSVLLDNKSKSFGEIQGISPMELLLMGIAGCSSIDIIAILDNQKIIGKFFNPHNLVNFKKNYAKFFLNIHAMDERTFLKHLDDADKDLDAFPFWRIFKKSLC